MLHYNFRYELKLLLRSQWIQLLSIVLLALFGFSVFNGKQKVQKRQSDIVAALEEVHKGDILMISLLDSVERGLQVSVPAWRIPDKPMAVGNYYPRLVAMEPQAMAFVSTGQADMYTHYVKPTVSGDDYALNFTEMTSPVQLLFGSFDLAFVMVYLLPLLIIAFSYNVLSAEKETGSLRLLGSQPIGIQTWVMQKLLLRFFWLSILVIGSLALVFLFHGVDFASNRMAMLALLALVLGYMLFWFAMAFFVNLWVGSSAKNAVALMGLWVVLVLLVPSVLNQLGTLLYPMPSRTVMINEMRRMKAEVAKKQDEILDNFLRDHPEYAVNDTAQARTFWHSYMASQNLVKQELAPIVDSYEAQLNKQQQWSGKLQWLSPALVFHQALNSIAGSSSEAYGDYRRQVIRFSESWRNHFMPFLYNNRSFKTVDFQKLPQFEYQPLGQKRVASTFMLMLLPSLSLLGLGFAIQYKGAGNGILSD